MGISPANYFPSARPTYPGQWVSGSVSEWVSNVSDFGDGCRIYRACQLVCLVAKYINDKSGAVCSCSVLLFLKKFLSLLVRNTRLSMPPYPTLPLCLPTPELTRQNTSLLLRIVIMTNKFPKQFSKYFQNKSRGPLQAVWRAHPP